MKIELHIDNDGIPYILLDAQVKGYYRDIVDEWLELFIKKAKENGVEIKNESEYEFDNTFASIKITFQ